MRTSKAIENLREALRILPGVGPKNAQRMAFHLLERNREGAEKLASSLTQALQTITNCLRCNMLCETQLCDICASDKRDRHITCVVETPADLEAIEQLGSYNGLYFVLMGRLSPLEGIGPEQLAFKRLGKLLAEETIKEIIIATNITPEGETTADYIEQLLAPYDMQISRLARGVPIGGELEYIDQKTLAAAFRERRSLVGN